MRLTHQRSHLLVVVTIVEAGDDQLSETAERQG